MKLDVAWTGRVNGFRVAADGVTKESSPADAKIMQSG
jgi:hypothetical protein